MSPRLWSLFSHSIVLTIWSIVRHDATTLAMKTFLFISSSTLLSVSSAFFSYLLLILYVLPIGRELLAVNNDRGVFPLTSEHHISECQIHASKYFSIV